MTQTLARRITTGVAAIVAVFAISLSQAFAVVDLTGVWVVTFDSGPANIGFIQNGTSLVTSPPPGGSEPAFAGTIDPDTGAFSLDLIYLPGGLTSCVGISGTAALDGNSFTGELLEASLNCGPPHLPCECGIASTSPVSGVRCVGACPLCGNGVLEGGEQCDDHNLTAGDCCSPLCEAEPSGAPCPDDGNQCTGDSCDAAGACQHPPNALPCGTTCQPAICAGGACVAAAAAMAGTPCASDAEVCTVDACDGAGLCAHGPNGGCTPLTQSASVALRNSGGVSNSLRWKWKNASGSTTLADFGSPTGSSSFHLCAFDGVALVLGADALSGAVCPSCWKSKPEGFKYSDSGLNEGIRKLVLKSSASGRSKLLVNGRGAALPFLGSLDTPALRTQLVRSDDGATAARCWEATFDNPTVTTPTDFEAREP